MRVTRSGAGGKKAKVNIPTERSKENIFEETNIQLTSRKSATKKNINAAGILSIKESI